MHAALSFLGAAMLILVGVVIVLATVILILYEACLIVRLGHQLTRGRRRWTRQGVGERAVRMKGVELDGP